MVKSQRRNHENSHLGLCNDIHNYKGVYMKYKVYLIENIVNGKVYVGWTSKSLEKRFYQHSKSNKVVGKAIKRYGEKSFSIKELDSFEDRESALKAEIKWITHYKSNIKDMGYNCTKGGDDSPVKRNICAYQTDEFREKMKQQATKQHSDKVVKDRHVNGIRKYWANLSEEERATRSKISSKNGSKGGQSRGFRQGIPNPKIKGNKNPRAKKYIVIRPDGITDTILCLKQYCIENNLTYRNAQYVVSGHQKHHKGYIFMRQEDTLS